MKYITVSQIRGHNRFTKLRPRNSGPRGHSKHMKNDPKNVGGIADSRKYAPEIRGHSKYTKIRPPKNLGGIADSCTCTCMMIDGKAIMLVMSIS